MKKEGIRLFNDEGKRTDGRYPNEIRPVRIEAGVLKNADGSAYIELGNNKILVAVYGPHEAVPKYIAEPDKAVIRCKYSMAPFSVSDRKSPQPSRREIELSKVIREALEPAIFLNEYPRTMIDVFIEVLEADGGTRTASITAASVALADAGISMKDLVTAIAVGKAEGKLIVDLNGLEDQYGEGDMPIAIMPQYNEVTLFQADGIFTPEEIEEAFRLASEAIKKLYNEQKKALKKKYEEVIKEVNQTE